MDTRWILWPDPTRTIVARNINLWKCYLYNLSATSSIHYAHVHTPMLTEIRAFLPSVHSPQLYCRYSINVRFARNFERPRIRSGVKKFQISKTPNYRRICTETLGMRRCYSLQPIARNGGVISVDHLDPVYCITRWLGNCIHRDSKPTCAIP